MTFNTATSQQPFQKFAMFESEVSGVTFSDSDSACVPKFLNWDPGLAILQL